MSDPGRELPAPAGAIRINPFACYSQREQSMPNSTRAELVATCAACNSPIAPGKGYIHVSLVEVGQVERARKKWDEVHPPGQVIDMRDLVDNYPRGVSWQVHHRACDPEPDTEDYWIDVDEVSTWAGLVARTAHLMGKNWFSVTDWSSVLEDAAHGHGKRIVPASGR